MAGGRSNGAAQLIAVEEDGHARAPHLALLRRKAARSQATSSVPPFRQRRARLDRACVPPFRQRRATLDRACVPPRWGPPSPLRGGIRVGGSPATGSVPLEGRLGGGEAGDRHAEGRAGDVVQPDLVAEGDRGRVAAVLAADADLEVGPRPCGRARPPISTSWPTPSWSIDGTGRRRGSFCDVGAEEGGDVVAAEAERHLGQVVGAEGEELGLSAISSAARAARGTSIIVPIR